MGTGRFVSSWVAVGTLFFFANLERAYADDLRLVPPQADGTCSGPIAGLQGGGSGGGGGGCGFLWIHCISRVAKDTYAAVTGTAMGLVIGVGAALAIGALIATAPVWVTVGVVAAGVALTGYGIYSTVKSWNQMNEQQKIYALGFWGGTAVGGGIAGHYAPVGAPDAAAGAQAGAEGATGPGGVAAESPLTIADLFREAGGTAIREADLRPEAGVPTEGWDPAWTYANQRIPDDVAWRLADSVYQESEMVDPYGGLRGIHDLLHQPSVTPEEASRIIEAISEKLTSSGDLRIQYVGARKEAPVPGLDRFHRGLPGNYGVWDDTSRTMILRRGIRSDPRQWLETFAHVYGESILASRFEGTSRIPLVEVSPLRRMWGFNPTITQLLDAMVAGPGP